MGTKDWIEIGISVVTAIVSIASIIIAVKSLKMTQKSIEDANKPYVYCYVSTSGVGTFSKYFIIRNSGKTPAYISDLKFNNAEGVFLNNNYPVSIIGATIAPGQQLATWIDPDINTKFMATITFKDTLNNVTTQTAELNSGMSSLLFRVVPNDRKLSDEANILQNLAHEIHKTTL